MFNIEKFLEKFSKNIESTEFYKKNISEIIKSNTNIDISIEKLEIKEYVVYTNSSPATLNKIFINKQKILEEINSKIPIKIVDIK